jgi:aminoglycoside phosphotransferase (APT) family kinase protein
VTSVPVPQRRLVDVDTVRRLIARQFPHWAALPVTPVATNGWDNQTFHLGDTLSVRLPTAAEYARAVDKEHRWLPVFAAHLPLRVPTPVAKGEPDEEYDHPWSIYEWIDGEPATTATIGDHTAFAAELAAFLVALRHVDPADGPGPGLHNWFRGGPLSTYDAQTRRALETLDGRIPTHHVTHIWETALTTAWDEPPVWFHGDIAPGNLLLRDGRLSAVIDFGTCGVGDPACDLAIAWTLLSGPARDTFHAGLDIDPRTWARGRGWALWKALILYAGAVRAGDPTDAEARVVDDIIDTDQ